MNFHIKKIKLWFYKHPEPKEYIFHPNKVNVITGDSSTGKSSIVQIIDYCLLAPESSIVEDVINENVSWFGLNFHLNGHDYVIARKAPSETGTADRGVFWAKDSNEMLDSTPIPTKDVTRASVLDELNQLFACSNLNFEKNKKEINLSFRYLLLLNFLTEDIIATSNSYFDSKFFSDKQIDNIITEVFKLGIGANELEEVSLANRMDKLKKEIKGENSNKDKDSKSLDKYIKGVEKIKKTAIDLDILPMGVEFDTEEYIAQVRLRIKEFNRYVSSSRAMKKIKQLEEESKQLNEQLNRYKLLRNQYNKAKQYAQKIEDSLSPIEYLKQNLDTVVMGSETVELFNSLEDAYKNTSQVKFNLPEDYLPADMEKHVEELKMTLEEVTTKRKELQPQIDRLYSPNWLAKVLKLTKDLKDLKTPTSTYKGDVVLTDLEDQFREITNQYNNLSAINQGCLDKMIEIVQTYYEQQDGMSSNYRNKTVVFDKERMSLKLMNNGAHFAIRNIGSKSNFMFMHLCFFLGMHEYIKSIKSERVANFLFIDQPSIPYYGTNRKNTGAEGRNTIKKDDATKLKAAFRLMDQFMMQNISSDGSDSFQIILIEHTDESYWEDLPSFETRYDFTVNKDFGLIPAYVTGDDE